MLIKGGTVHDGNGGILHDCDILIEDGAIKKVGTNIESEGGQIIDAAGREIFPGFIDPVNYLGCIDMAYKAHDTDEISEPITPDVCIKHGFDPDEMTYQQLYKSGITSVGTAPGNMNIIGGQTALMKTIGNNVNKMLVKDCVALKGSVINLVRETYGGRGTAPNSRMAVMQMLSSAFEKAYSYEVKGENFRQDSRNEVLKKVLAGQMPLIIAADTKAEIESVVESLKEFESIRLIFCNSYQAAQAADAIKKSRAGVIIGELSNSAKEVYYETNLKEIVKLHSEGVPMGISLLTDDNVYGRETYFWTVAKLRKAGATCEEVLSMMTAEPARMLGVSDRIGSIEAGKDGDVVIFDKDPTERCDATLLWTVIRGEVAYEKGGTSCC